MHVHGQFRMEIYQEIFNTFFLKFLLQFKKNDVNF